MDAFIERFRGFWGGLSQREQRMMTTLGLVLSLLVLTLPLVLLSLQNGSIEDENQELRDVLGLIAERRASLELLADARRNAEARYKNQTPPLGTYLEAEAKKHGLSLFEVTEQPEKTEGVYHRRAVRAAINDVGLTAIMNLLAGIVTGQHPVAIDHLQIEHFQSGDVYRLRLGVLTYDRKTGASASASKGKGG
jgi:hypothetical protein